MENFKSIYQRFIADKTKEFERKLVLNILAGKSYIEIAEKSELTLKEVDDIFRKWLLLAESYMTNKEGKLEDWIKTINKL